MYFVTFHHYVQLKEKGFGNNLKTQSMQHKSVFGFKNAPRVMSLSRINNVTFPNRGDPFVGGGIEKELLLIQKEHTVPASRGGGSSGQHPNGFHFAFVTRYVSYSFPR